MRMLSGGNYDSKPGGTYDTELGRLLWPRRDSSRTKSALGGTYDA